MVQTEHFADVDFSSRQAYNVFAQSDKGISMNDVNLVSVTGQSYGPSFSLVNITVTSGGPSSPDQGHGDLVVPWHDLQEDPSIFALLSWHTRTSEFKGRDEELAELLSWAKDSRRISVKFITGPGGAGKSRLAAEFATMLQSESWAAGFVDLRKPQTVRGHPEGMLLIVDYPEEHRSAVKELFQALAKLQNVKRLRVLFLTRQQISNWKDDIQDARVESLTDMKPIRLAGLDGVHAHEVYLSASDKIGETLDSKWKPINQEALSAWLDEAPENDLALFIVAAAAHNTLQPEDARIKYKGPDIIKSLVQREMSRLRNLAASRNIPDRYLFARLLAIATIAGDIPSDRLDGMLAQTASQELPDHFDATCEFQNAGLMVDRRIQAVKPDIVAAAFVVDVLSRKPEIAPELIWLALNEDINGGMQRLSRLSYDAEVVLGLHQYRLSRWLAEAVKDNLERARTLESFVSKEPPIGLLDVAIVTWQTLLPATKKESEKARILNNLSVGLFSVGDRNGAIATILKAVEIRERLADANPETFEPDLAGSLNNLGNGYAELGKREEALDACKRAVGIYERLANAHPETFEPDLAMSLNNLGALYAKLGKREEALEACKRAVEIRERLADANPETFEPDLATSLNNLGNGYAGLGKREEALDACKRAVGIYERLADANPETFEPDLAMSLNNLGNGYAGLGKHEEVLEACKRAVEIYERLTDAHPETFEPDLATSLNNLGSGYARLGKRKEALEACKRAVEIRERLADANPEIFKPDLAMSLNNLGNRYSELGKREEALEACKRAVEIRERLADANPETFEPDLAMSYGALGNTYRIFDEHIESVAVFKNAILTLKRLFLLNPEAFGSLMIALVRYYRETSEKIEVTPDVQFLSEILEILQEIKRDKP